MARILIVDDDPDVREFLMASLELEGHEPRAVDDGRLALAAVSVGIPDLIILDLAMPGMDGWRVLEELHRRGIRSHTRILLMSGHFESDDLQGRHTADRFISKPFGPETLLPAVEEILAQDPSDLYTRREHSRDLVSLLGKMDATLSG